MFLKLILVYITLHCTLAAQKCDLPPSLWCSTRDTAERCKVYEQCKEFNTVKNDATPVNVTLYHESLCPDCINFITTSLWTAFTKVSQIFTLTLVPYGNAMEKKEVQSYKFICQHGEGECVGNLIESCADFYIKDWRAAFNFTHCIANTIKKTKTYKIPKLAEKCAKEQNVNYDQIKTCANGAQGNALEHQMAVRTRALNPPHKYVPWVTINGVHTEAIQTKAEDDLVKLVCDTYQGPKPSACQEKQPRRACLHKEL